MQKIIKKHKITIPVIYIRNSLYLIGAARCTCELKVDQVFVKVGQEQPVNFAKYITQNHSHFKFTLYNYIKKSGLSLEAICVKLSRNLKAWWIDDPKQPKGGAGRERKGGAKSPRARSPRATSPPSSNRRDE